MEILLVGLNHKTADVELREKLVISDSKIESALSLLKNYDSLKESAILSTCNRTEVYAVSDDEGVSDKVVEFLSEFNNIERNLFVDKLYFKRGLDVIKHIARVGAGLDSMVVGETQIFGQVKESYKKAFEMKNTGKIFNILFQKIFNIVKKIRTDTEIGKMPVSVSSAAVSLAEQIFGELKGKSIIIVGAGKMSELTAKHLLDDGARSIFVANRTYEKALILAKGFSGIAIHFDELSEYLTKVDIVIVSTNAPHYVITKNNVASIMSKRRYSPLFFIDISVPRNVDPEINKLENIFLYNIDDLKDVVEKNQSIRNNEINKAETIIEKDLSDIIKILPEIVC